MSLATSSASENFYRDLVGFSDFGDLVDPRHYSKLPGDWSVVITDVEGSTKAIEEGRYQDVNTVGAASISVLGKLWQSNEIPFVFGGDGSSLLVPPSKLDRVVAELLRLKNLAIKNFDLNLRIGVVPMTDIVAAGLSVDVAKFSVPGAKPIAFMRGGGLSWADAKIKSDPETYGAHDDQAGTLGELKDLSCRWQPLKSRKGRILSLLVKPRSQDAEVSATVLTILNEVLGHDLHELNPANEENMNYKSLSQTLKSEFKYHAKHFDRSYFARIFWSLFSVWSIGAGRRAPFDARKYRKSIPKHSDYRKFDDMLRLVIDCEAGQIEKIRVRLEGLYRDGQIFYGLHESDHAIMTCLVGTIDDGQHIHFIDGGAGGYAMAAKPLKEQMALANA